MTRINTNIPSVIAQSNLTRTQKELQVRFERLSTGLRINRGSDDPAGLIISERLRSDVQGVSTGIKNSDRASSVISTTEAALSEISDLLNSIKSLIVEAANTGGNSADERNANQLQIDSAIDSITRISNTASFGGLKLLNGGLDYRLSGQNIGEITKASVTGASLVNASNIKVDVDVVASAQTAGLFYQGGTPAGTILSKMTIEVAGNRGVQVINIASGTTLAALQASINQLTPLTGVKASLVNGNANSGLAFKSELFGSDQFVSVKRLGKPATGDSFVLKSLSNNAAVPTTFNWASGSLSSAEIDYGQDVSALINGNLASGRGLNVSINSSALSLDLNLAQAFATNPTATNSTFYITGGGALFQLGQDVTALQQANVGVRSVAASSLGGTLINGTQEYLSSLKSGQNYSISNSVQRRDFTGANDILQTAIDEISILRGRIGAFERNVLQTNTRSLQTALENLTASSSAIRDADFATETSGLTRAQILSSSGTQVLSLANQQSNNVLQLLQR